MRRISHHFHVFYSFLIHMFVFDKKKKIITLLTYKKKCHCLRFFEMLDVFGLIYLDFFIFLNTNVLKKRKSCA